MFLRFYQIVGSAICGLFLLAVVLGWKLPESTGQSSGLRGSGGHHSFWQFGK